MQEEESTLLEDEENDYNIEEFCKQLNSKDYKCIQAAKDIFANFKPLNEILAPLN